MSHHAELNSEAELIVIAPAQINLEGDRPRSMNSVGSGCPHQPEHRKAFVDPEP
jgi:hypothetical protein